MDCNTNFIGTGLLDCSKNEFNSGIKSVYFNPKTKEVFSDKEMKHFIGIGKYDCENRILEITR